MSRKSNCSTVARSGRGQGAREHFFAKMSPGVREPQRKYRTFAL